VGRVQTVLGMVEAGGLGVTLAHEHVIHDMRVYFQEPEDPADAWRARAPVAEADAEWVRAHRTSNLDNLWLDSETAAIAELAAFKACGGGTVVELTTKDVFGQNPAALARIARESGVNIVMGTGYDLIVADRAALAGRSEEQLVAELVADIEEGVVADGAPGGGRVHAGIIGEIGLADIGPLESKVLRACARAQRATGAALSVHPSAAEEQLPVLVAVLREAGADLERTIICHADLMGFSADALRAVARAGCYVGFDNFGMEGLFRHPGSGKPVTLSDQGRTGAIRELADAGYLERILVSHDIASKDRLRMFGGHGYTHVSRRIVPLLLAGGVTEQAVSTILEDNPQRVLSLT